GAVCKSGETDPSAYRARTTATAQ
ncbi:hypothetical protein LCGC14_1611160, partial [marine sediment metagenome]